MRTLAAAKLNCWLLGVYPLAVGNVDLTSRTPNGSPLTARRVFLAVQARNLFGPWSALCFLWPLLPLVFFRSHAPPTALGFLRGNGVGENCLRAPPADPQHLVRSAIISGLKAPARYYRRLGRWTQACLACKDGRAERASHFPWGTSVHWGDDVHHRRVYLPLVD